jgi:hypothetical protein
MILVKVTKDRKILATILAARAHHLRRARAISE